VSKTAFDLLVIGAGPAGAAAAVTARELGMSVAVLDDQPAPGGQIWRGIERAGKASVALGPDYAAGLPHIQALRSSGAMLLPGTQAWQIEPGWHVFASRERRATMYEAKILILATGAMERPAPFPGWTLPGVLTVGAAQILLKTSAQIPSEPVWIAGSGPLPLLYATQLLEAGGRVAAILDTTSPTNRIAALRLLPQALLGGGAADLVKGMGLLRKLRKAGVRIVRDVKTIAASGVERVETIEFMTSNGHSESAPAGMILVHEGVVPNVHPSLSIGCEHDWNEAQICFVPRLDAWMETSKPGLFVAGDGGGIGGARAAPWRGQIAAIGAAMRIGALSRPEADKRAVPLRHALSQALASRPFIDALFRPRPGRFIPDDSTIVCRCEELTAGELRRAAIGRQGPNQLKAYTRVGMGPCQARQCGYTVAHILADMQGRAVAEVGLQRIRPPLKPVTVGELAALDAEAAS